MKTESSNRHANPLEAIRSEFETIPDTTDIGMLSIKSANRTLEDAARRPDPEQLYLELWYEGEVCCLFADSNLGKSIFAVQMADTISQTRRVLYVDCELSDKQFQLRYTDKETGQRHLFPDNLFRAEINPCAIGVERYEENIIKDIEMAAIRTATDVIIIDNLTYLCNSSDKGVDAGLFMMNLMNLKKKYGWSLLIIAHTPKRSLMSPITQNDLAGSKKLYNFFDSVFAIGQSAKDKRLRYVKQVKVRAGAFKYDSSNVIVYEIEKMGDFLGFEFKEFATEADHLKQRTENELTQQELNVLNLHKQGFSYRNIAERIGISKSTVNNIVKKHLSKAVQPSNDDGHVDTDGQLDIDWVKTKTPTKNYKPINNEQIPPSEIRRNILTPHLPSLRTPPLFHTLHR